MRSFQKGVLPSLAFMFQLLRMALGHTIRYQEVKHMQVEALEYRKAPHPY
jgi:hypothetical protein